MGAVLSLFKDHEPKSVQPAGSVPEDPRSPTVGIARTPIAIDKRQPYLETDIDNLTPTLPLRVKLLRKIADPRSPTIGINRTPIALSDTNFESPVSLYSNYQTEIGSETCMSPECEPSMNVSDFESEFARELDTLVEQLDKSMVDSPVSDFEPQEVAKPVLSLKDDSAKKLCEELVAEIIESFQEFQDEVKNAKPVTPKKKLKLVVAPAAVPITKKRKPLTNITSSAGNTPTKQFQSLRKDDKIVKVDKSGENSPLVMSSRKVRAQWDHDSTVVI